MEIPSKKNDFVKWQARMKSDFPSSVDILFSNQPFNSCSHSDHPYKHDFPAGHKTLSVNSFQTYKQRQNHFSCGLHN
jgi:hypothetical protein